MSLKVIAERCPQNHPCPSVRVCKEGALKQSGVKAPTVDKEKCTECGACTQSCPMGALTLE